MYSCECYIVCTKVCPFLPECILLYGKMWVGERGTYLTKMKISTLKEKKKSLEYLCELRCTTLLCINMVFKVSGKYNTK
jgi:ABC-type uncharacterized transport system ATPase subunit